MTAQYSEEGLKNWLIDEGETLLEAIKRLDTVKGAGIVVVAKNNVLKGTLTDGDVRRFLLRKGDLEAACVQAANRDCHKLKRIDGRYKPSEETLPERCPIPIVNEKDIVLAVKYIEENREDHEKNTALIMAGGLGTRLRPLTNQIPKPLLKIGGIPMIERIIIGLKESGITDVYISIRYLKQKIIEYVGDGKKFGVNITYIDEEDAMGTAGSISRASFKKRLVVCNGDIVTTLDFSKLLKYHKENGRTITVATRLYAVHIPFGVLDIENNLVKRIEEKPKKCYPVAAGIYVIEKEILNLDNIKRLMQEGKAIDMPELIAAALSTEAKVNCFVIHEDWTDVGTVESFHEAQNRFHTA